MLVISPLHRCRSQGVESTDNMCEITQLKQQGQNLNKDMLVFKKKKKKLAIFLDKVISPG